MSLPIKVAVIEDDLFVLQYLSGLIENSRSCELAGTASDKSSAFQLINNTQVDIYLIDLGLPDVSGIELIDFIHQKFSQAQSIVLSNLSNINHIVDSFHAGASGYILKSDSPENLIQKIEDVFHGKSPISGSVARMLITNMFNHSTTVQVHHGLTKREKEILFALHSDDKGKTIADKLHISIFTLNQHTRKIYEKLNVRSRLAAVNAAKKHGLLKE